MKRLFKKKDDTLKVPDIFGISEDYAHKILSDFLELIENRTKVDEVIIELGLKNKKGTAFKAYLLGRFVERIERSRRVAETIKEMDKLIGGNKNGNY